MPKNKNIKKDEKKVEDKKDKPKVKVKKKNKDNVLFYFNYKK